MTTVEFFTIAGGLIVALLGSGLIQFLITRHDAKKGIAAQNSDRMQLMLLIADYPRKTDEILEVAKHYFVILKGNSFIKTLFSDWLRSQNIDPPEWFKEANCEKNNIKRQVVGSCRHSGD